MAELQPEPTMNRLRALVERLRAAECPHGGCTAVFHLEPAAANEKLKLVFEELKDIAGYH